MYYEQFNSQSYDLGEQLVTATKRLEEWCDSLLLCMEISRYLCQFDEVTKIFNNFITTLYIDRKSTLICAKEEKLTNRFNNPELAYINEYLSNCNGLL